MMLVLDAVNSSKYSRLVCAAPCVIMMNAGDGLIRASICCRRVSPSKSTTSTYTTGLIESSSGSRASSVNFSSDTFRKFRELPVRITRHTLITWATLSRPLGVDGVILSWFLTNSENIPKTSFLPSEEKEYKAGHCLPRHIAQFRFCSK